MLAYNSEHVDYFSSYWGCWGSCKPFRVAWPVPTRTCRIMWRSSKWITGMVNSRVIGWLSFLDLTCKHLGLAIVFCSKYHYVYAVCLIQYMHVCIYIHIYIKLYIYITCMCIYKYIYICFLFARQKGVKFGGVSAIFYPWIPLRKWSWPWRRCYTLASKASGLQPCRRFICIWHPCFLNSNEDSWYRIIESLALVRPVWLLLQCWSQ